MNLDCLWRFGLVAMGLQANGALDAGIDYETSKGVGTRVRALAATLCGVAVERR